MIEQGEQAQDFELADRDGRPVRLSDLRGRRVILYFYRRGGHPGLHHPGQLIRKSPARISGSCSTTPLTHFRHLQYA